MTLSSIVSNTHLPTPTSSYTHIYVGEHNNIHPNITYTYTHTHTYKKQIQIQIKLHKKVSKPRLQREFFSEMGLEAQRYLPAASRGMSSRVWVYANTKV